MKRFKKIYIEITNICNLACTFCPQTSREPKFMTVENFGRILNEIKPYSDYIYLHVKGEPLLHPELSVLLDISSRMGLKVNITTNGTLIGGLKEMLASKPSIRQINISLHSLDKNEMLWKAEEYLKDIFEFTSYALRNSNMIIAYRLWNLSKEGQLDTIARENQYIINCIEQEFDLQYRIMGKALTDRGLKLRDRVYLNFDYEFKWPETNCEEEDKRGFCHGLKNQAAILVDGTVVPCCLDGEGIINLGNVLRSGFGEIIEGERAKAIFEGFSRREVIEELCRKCDYRRRFNS